MSDEAETRALLGAELRARRDSMPPSLARATWELLLGEIDASVRTLEATHAATPSDADPAGRPGALALLAGDREAARRHAARELTAGANWVPGWREYHAAMSALIAAGDAATVESRIEALDAYARAHDRLPSGPPVAVADIPRGIAAGDAARASGGLDALLGWHLRSARSRGERFNSANGAICLDAIVALLIAHERGLEVSIDAKYREASIPVLVVHITDWEGRPLPRLPELSLTTDLVAGPWLARRGMDVGSPAVGPSAPSRTRERRRSLGGADIDASVARDFLRQQVAGELGSRWQLMSWALMLGDTPAARHHLDRQLADARRTWEESRPARGGILRHLLRSQELPNANYLRAHFGLALAAGDERGMGEAGDLLRAWMDAVEEDDRRQSRPLRARYGHAAGYLDYIADLLGPRGPRAPADQVSGVPRELRAACVGLERADAALVEEAVDAILRQHAAQLERKTSPPAPVCAEALHVAAAANRRGLAVRANDLYHAYAVPISIRDPLRGGPGIARLPADLLGRALFGLA